MVNEEIIEHVDAALAELAEAREKAGVGTALMLGEPQADLRDLRGRLENITEEEQ